MDEACSESSGGADCRADCRGAAVNLYVIDGGLLLCHGIVTLRASRHRQTDSWSKNFALKGSCSRFDFVSAVMHCWTVNGGVRWRGSAFADFVLHPCFHASGQIFPMGEGKFGSSARIISCHPLGSGLCRGVLSWVLPCHDRAWVISVHILLMRVDGNLRRNS